MKRDTNFEIKKRIVLQGGSKLLKSWQEHSTITTDQFLEALEWVCDDPLTEWEQPTREVGLTPTGYVKLARVYAEDSSFIGFYKKIPGSKFMEHWNGELFYRDPVDEEEEEWAINGKIAQISKCCFNCFDRL